MEDRGFLGIIITIVLYIGILMTNCLGFYNYIVFLHFEGRIIDIYTRVTAPRKHFFLPLDNEVSVRYFTWVLVKVRLENEKYQRTGGLVGVKKFSVTCNKVTEAIRGYKRKVVHVTIYRRNDKGTLVVYRHFVKTDDGTICELEEGVPFAIDEHPLLERWPGAKRRPHVRNSNDNLMPPIEDLEEEKKNEAGSYNLDMEANSDVEIKAEKQY
eukprot:TRINITY_DN2001_c0_g1_i2.p1 TRINITY_DN2001_c0_g1~~TRINITY_DN2001_c0_g1_i2.p1  ORF type:complete len:212 (-),score=48.43 TRINITY_DN2001_c0_g1_i2:972-1607(-)